MSRTILLLLTLFGVGGCTLAVEDGRSGRKTSKQNDFENDISGNQNSSEATDPEADNPADDPSQATLGPVESTPCSSGFFRPSDTGECRPHSSCPDGQFVQTHGTATSDTQCAPHSSCPDGQFVQTHGTATSDTQCVPYTQCPPGHHTTTAGTATTDRVCAPHTPCPDGHYVTTPATDTSDNICAPHNTCLAGTYLHTPGTTETDNDCRPHSSCPDGQFVQTRGTATNDTQCAPHSSCPDGQFVQTRGTATNDTQCAPYTQCPPGHHTTTAGTATTDRVCAPHTPCQDGHYASTPATDTSDNVCTPHSTCLAGTYLHTPGTTEADNDCRAFTTCAANQFMVSDGTATRDRVCRAHTSCDGNSLEDQPPSATQDRTCRNRNLIGRSHFTRREFAVWVFDTGYDVSASANRSLNIRLGESDGSFTASALTCGTNAITASGTSCPVNSGVVTLNYSCSSCQDPGSFTFAIEGRGSQHISYAPETPCSAVPNLASALSNAQNNETLCLPAGNYTSQSTFFARQHLSITCPSQRCILTTQGSDVILHSQEARNSPLRIDGLTLRDAVSTNFGGGVELYTNSDIEISNTLIVNNRVNIASGSLGSGAGLYILSNYSGDMTTTPRTTLTLRQSAIVGNHQIAQDSLRTGTGLHFEINRHGPRPGARRTGDPLTARASLVLDKSFIFGNVGRGARAGVVVLVRFYNIASESRNATVDVSLLNSIVDGQVLTDGSNHTNLSIDVTDGDLTTNLCGVTSLARCTRTGGNCSFTPSCSR